MVKAFAPATVANLACGFDVLGLAIDLPGDIVSIESIEGQDIKILDIKGAEGRLTYDPAKNTIGVSVLEFCKFHGIRDGLGLKLEKNMPLGSGLGSSAASTVAALVAVNAMYGSQMTKQELLKFAMEGERVACGAAHADNVGPCLFGGISLVSGHSETEIIALPVPEMLVVLVVHPHIEINTRDSRAVLPEAYPLKTSVQQSANLGTFISALFLNDMRLLKKSLKDVIAEPYRAGLIPGFSEIQEAAMEAGALGCSISGSGPSIFAFADNLDCAEKVKQCFENTFSKKGIGFEIYHSKVNLKGAFVLEAK